MTATTIGNDPSPEFLGNHPAFEIRLGDSASLECTVTQHDIQLFAAVTADVNPAHVDASYASASASFFHEIIAHGMLGGAWISSVLGTRLPGPGTIDLGQTLNFLKPVHTGDTLIVTVTVSAIDGDQGHVTLATQCVNQHDERVSARGIPTNEELMIALHARSELNPTAA